MTPTGPSNPWVKTPLVSPVTGKGVKPIAPIPSKGTAKDLLKTGAEALGQSAAQEAITRIIEKAAVDGATKQIAKGSGTVVAKVISKPFEATISELSVELTKVGKAAVKAAPFVGDAIGLAIDLYGDYEAAKGFNDTFRKRAYVSGGVFIIGAGSDLIPGVGTIASILIAVFSSVGGELIKVKLIK
jgi:hypothetical protein